MTDPEGVIITAEEQQAREQVLPGLDENSLLDAMHSPEYFEEIARADLLVQMSHMRRLSLNADFSMSARLEYIKQLKAMGKVGDSKAGNTLFDNLPMIQINLPGSGGQINLGAPPPIPSNDKDVVDVQRPSKAVMP